MAGLSDVEAGFVSTITNALWPGKKTPDPKKLTRTSITVAGTPVPIRVYREWPSPDALAAELNAGGANISVWPIAYSSRPKDLNKQPWTKVAEVPVTVVLTVDGRKVTVSGSGTDGQFVGVGYDKTGWVYPITGDMSAEAIAAELGGLVPGATVAGAVITMPSNRVEVRVGSKRTVLREVRRQTQRIIVSTWAPDGDIRDAVADRVTLAFATKLNVQLAYGYLTEAVKYFGSSVHSTEEREGIFRRDDAFEVEYATHEVAVVPPVMFVGINTNVGTMGQFSPAGPINYIW